MLDTCPLKIWSCWASAKFHLEALQRLFSSSVENAVLRRWFLFNQTLLENIMSTLLFSFKQLQSQCNQLFINELWLFCSPAFPLPKGSEDQSQVIFFPWDSLWLFLPLAFGWCFENLGLSSQILGPPLAKMEGEHEQQWKSRFAPLHPSPSLEGAILMCGPLCPKILPCEAHGTCWRTSRELGKTPSQLGEEETPQSLLQQ